MSVILMLYFVSIVDSFTNILFLLFGIGIILLFLMFVIWAFTYGDHYHDDLHQNMEKLLIWPLKHYWILLIPILILCLVPNRQTMYLLISSHYLNNSDLSPKIAKVIDIKLNEIINSIQKEKKDDK